MNIFTNDDYRRIQAWLKKNAIKDSDFAISLETVPEEDILVITLNMATVPTNYRIKIKDLLNSSLGKVVINSITAKSVKVNNVLTVDAANVKLDNEKGTTLLDVLNYFEENKLNRHTDDTFDGNLTIKKDLTIEGHIKSDDGLTTVEENFEVTGEITDGQGNMLSDVNLAAKGWKIEYQDPQQDEPTVRAKYVLKDYRGVPKGNVIKVYKDSAITNVYRGTIEDTCNSDTGEVTKKPIHDNNEALSIVYRLDTGKYMLVNVPLGIFTREAEFDKYRGLGIEPNGQVFIKLASDVESSNYLHFNSLGEIAADGIEDRILRDLGTLISSVAGDGTMWGQYKQEEGTQETSTPNDGSRWGEFKKAEAIRDKQVSDEVDKIQAKVDEVNLETIKAAQDKAVQAVADREAEILAKSNASEISYTDNNLLEATNVQNAIDNVATNFNNVRDFVGIENKCVLEGRGQTYISKKIIVAPNTTYVIRPIKTTWFVDKNTLGYTAEAFSIREGTKAHIIVYIDNNSNIFTSLEQEYTITTGPETHDLTIGGRASLEETFGISYSIKSNLNESLHQVSDSIKMEYNDSLQGKNADWTIKKLTAIKLLANMLYKIILDGNITFAGSGTQTFLKVQLRRDDTVIKTLKSLDNEQSFEKITLDVTSSEDTYLYIEGRWHDNETLNITIEGGISTEVNIIKSNLENTNTKLNTLNNYTRNKAILAYQDYINFDNNTKKVIIGAILLANPSATTGRIEIPKTELDYTFNSKDTTVWTVVYNITSKEYRWETHFNIKNDDIIIANCNISGTSTSAKVNKITSCIANDYRIDNILLTSIQDEYAVYFSDGKIPTFITSGQTIKITMPSATMYFVQSTKNSINVTVNGEVYTLANYYKLVFDTNTNQFTVIDRDTNKLSYINCALNNGGIISGGCLSLLAATANLNEVKNNFISEINTTNATLNNLVNVVGKNVVTDSLAGNNTDWRTKTYSYTLKKGIKVIITLDGQITYAGTGNSTFINIQLLKVGTKTVLYNLLNIKDTQKPFEKTKFILEPSEDVQLYVEGRWHDNENLEVIIDTDIFANVKDLQNDCLYFSKELNSNISIIENNGWFIDNNLFRKSPLYDSITIPVSGGGKLKATANSLNAFRVARLNSLNLDDIIWGTTTIDGLSNTGCAVNTSCEIDIPETCKYLVVSSKYNQEDALPVFLEINDVNYTNTLKSIVQSNYKKIKELEVSTKESIAELKKEIHDNNPGSYKCQGKGSTYLTQEIKVPLNRIIEVVLQNVSYIGCYPGYSGATVFTIVGKNSKTDAQYTFVNIKYEESTPILASYIFESSDAYDTYIIGFRQEEGTVCEFIISDITSSSIERNVIKRNAHKEPAIRSTGIKVRESEIKQLSFVHISDTHTIDRENGNWYKCLWNVRKLMEYYTNIKFGIITGDIIYDHFKHPMDCYDKVFGDFKGFMFNVIGNHDVGQWHDDLESVGTDEQVYEKYIQPYEEHWQLDSNTGKPYYYKDFVDEKVRLVVLYEFETDFEISPTDPQNLKYSREYRAMRQTQIDWIIETLMNTPEDYGVIFAYHMPDKMAVEDNNFVSDYLKGYESPTFNYASDKNFLLKIFDAFQKKKAIDFTFNQTGGVVTTLHVQADFTQKQSEFICVLAGHTHNDYIGHFYNYPDLLLLVVGSDNLHYTGKYCQRAYNQQSEDLINIVNVDRNRKTISVIRVGADASVTGQDRRMITLSYLPKISE